MPRIYRRQLGARRYNDFTSENLEAALRAVADEGYSYRQAADRYGVSRATICRKFRGQQGLQFGGQKVFSDAEEKGMVDAILVAAKWGFPLTPIEIRAMIQKYLNHKGVVEKRFKDNMPGQDWLRAFLKRNDELTVRLSQNIKRARALISKDTINAYFDNIETNLENVPPDNILNYDETNLTDDPGQVKVVVRRGVKHPSRIMDYSKSSTSVMFCVSAGGTLLPPYIVYKAKNLYPEWVEGGPQGAVYNRSKSGWFDGPIFEDFFHKLILPYFRNLNGAKVIIGDNLASHISINIVRKCEENNIKFILLPPNTTHVCQPLDVAYFRPLKVEWRKVLTKWKANNRGCIPKTSFPALLKKTLSNMENNREQNIQAGFRASGLYPINRTKVLRHFPEENNEQLNVNIEPLRQSFEDVIAKYAPKKVTQKRTRKFKIIPGESMTSALINNILNQPESTKKEKDKKRKRTPESTEAEQPGISVTDSDIEIVFESEDENNTPEAKAKPNVELTPVSTYIGINRFVVALFCYNKGTKKEIIKQFVSKILKIENEKITVQSLRPYRGSKNSFVYPDVDDISNIKIDEIRCVLTEPTICRGRHTFATDIIL